VSERPAAPPTATPEDADASSLAEELIDLRLWRALGEDILLAKEGELPSRFPHARERLLMCRLYLGLIRSVGADFGAPFVAHADSAATRAVGIHVLFRTMLSLPANAGAIAHALKLPRATVLHGLQQLMKHGYVERVGNAYRVTEKVNLPDLDNRIQARIQMIADTARELAEVRAAIGDEAPDTPLPGEP
jgi:hypothetical protein